MTEEDLVLARHRAFAEVLKGERPMGWSDWTMPIYESRCLTPEGQRVALWAVETLRRVLGNNFPEEAVKRGGHPIYSLEVWPANMVPRIYANLFQLAAQLQLPGKRRGKVREALRTSWDPTLWIHSLLQLELAGFAARAGWDCHFEPILGSNKGDLLLTNGPAKLLLEVTTMRQSDDGQKADQFFHRVSAYAWHLAGQHSLSISGPIGDPLPPEAEALWLQQMEVNVRATARDGKTRWMLSSAGGRLEIAKDASRAGTALVESAPTRENIWPRLEARLREKNRQVAEGGLAWLRLEEHAGLWHFTPLQRMSLEERLNVLTVSLQESLEAFTNLAGVILSPVMMWAGGASGEAVSARVERNGGIAVRSPIPGHRVRETIIVRRGGLPDAEAKLFADWYQDESSWLNWALERQGHPQFDALVQEEPGAD